MKRWNLSILTLQELECRRRGIFYIVMVISVLMFLTILFLIRLLYSRHDFILLSVIVLFTHCLLPLTFKMNQLNAEIQRRKKKDFKATEKPISIISCAKWFSNDN